MYSNILIFFIISNSKPENSLHETRAFFYTVFSYPSLASLKLSKILSLSHKKNIELHIFTLHFIYLMYRGRSILYWKKNKLVEFCPLMTPKNPFKMAKK